MAVNILQTVGLTKRFSKRTVLDHVSISIQEGSICGLVGVNGAGKTTTIKILMNILQPTEGCAEILGRDSRQLSAEGLTQIGYVSENQELPSAMSVSALLRYLKPFYPTWNDSLATDLLRQFELPADRKIRHLSHGMRMKVALVAALAYRPRLLILDEPFTGLDPLVRNELIEGVLLNLNGATVLVSSHDLAELESFATHIVYLNNGRLLLSEEMTALSQRFREIEVTLQGAPSTSLPGTWLSPEYSGAQLRFIDSDFEHQRTFADLHRRFGEPLNIHVRSMTLLSIFLALAKSERQSV